MATRLLTTGERPGIRVKYAIDGAWRALRTWDPSAYDARTESAFAPKTQVDDIIPALQGGAQQLEFDVYWSGESSDPTRYRFDTEGFVEAFKPLDAACW